MSTSATFAEEHLCFLSVDGKWWPGLVFDSYYSCQHIFEKIGGFGILQGLVLNDWMNRTFVDTGDVVQPTEGKLAILLGANKRVLWSDSFPESTSFYQHIPDVYNGGDLSTDHKNAILEGQQFLFLKYVAVNERDASLPSLAPQEVETSHQHAEIADPEDTAMGEANAHQPLSTQENQGTPSVPETPPTADPQEQEDTPTVIASVDSFDYDGPTVTEQRSSSPTNTRRSLPSRTARIDVSAPVGTSAEDAKENKRANRRSKSALKKASRTAPKKAVKKTVKKNAPKKNLSSGGAKHKSRAVVKEEPRSSPRNSKRAKEVQFKDATETQRCESHSKALTEEEEIAELNSVPNTRVVLELLEDLGYTTHNKHFFRPGSKYQDKKDLTEGFNYFPSVQHLRRFLCRHGVESIHSTTFLEMSKDDRDLVEKWVRYAICPRLRDKREIPEDAREPYSSIHLPLIALGFTCKGGTTYFFPKVKPKTAGGLVLNGFPLNGPNGLSAMLCRHGLPDTCNFQNLSESDQLRLQLYLVDCPMVDTFSFEEVVDSALFDVASSIASSKKSISGRKIDATSQTLPVEKPDSVHSVQTPIVANKASCLTSQPTTDQGSVAAESIAPTIVTNCSTGMSSDNNIGKSDAFIEGASGIESNHENTSMDESEENFMPLTQAESDGKPSLSPLQHDESIADAHAGPKAGSSPLGPAPTKTLFQHTPAEVTEKRKIMSIAGKDSESVPQLPSEDSSVTKEALEKVDEASPSIASEGGGEEEVSRSVESDAFLVSKNDPDAPSTDKSKTQSTPLKDSESANQNKSPFREDIKMDLSDNECKTSPDVVKYFCDDQNEGDQGDFMLTQEPYQQHEEDTIFRELSMDTKEGETAKNVATANETQAEAEPADNRVGEDDTDEDSSMDTANEKQTAAASSSDQENTPDEKDDVDETKYEKWIDDLRGVVEPNGLWAEVEQHMRAYGLKWGIGTYIFPGRRGSEGVLGWDYVDKRADLQQLAVDRLNWKGDEIYRAEKDGRLIRRDSIDATNVQKRKAKSPTSTQQPVAKQARKVESPRSQTKSRMLTAPEKKKLIGEKLDSCKRVLQGASRNFRKLAIVDDSESSTFKSQVTEIQEFLEAAITPDSTGHGVASNDSILYICGSPGVGKTSTVEWCCAKAEGVNWCCINVASGDYKAILADAGEIFGMKVKNPTITTLTNFVKKSEELVVLVIDEIDSLVSARGVESSSRNGGEKMISDLCSLAADPELPFVLIGISNAVDTGPARRLKFVGMNGKRLPFAPYRQADLVQLVVSRIGDTIVDAKALNFVAARVAAGSGDARQMMEVISKAVEHKKSSLSELSLKAAAPEKPLVTIRDAVQAIKANAPEKYSRQIESLPEMAQLVLCVAVSMCKEYPENLSMKKLRTYCCSAAQEELGDSLDFGTFMTLMQLLVDQGLIMPNRDGDNNLNSKGFGAMLEMKVHFGAQLQDVESAVIDILTEKPIYQRLVDHAKLNISK